MAHEADAAFVGRAKVSLQSLHFEASLDTDIAEIRPLDPRNVDRLLDIFHLTKADRLNSCYYVPGGISGDDLQTALSNASLALDDLRGRQISDLRLPNDTITLYRGRHRLAAAKQHLAPNDQWWIVDLYQKEGKASYHRARTLLIGA